MRARRSSPVAASSNVARSGPDRPKRTAGKATAIRLTTSVMAPVSARSPFRNLSRAGVAKKQVAHLDDGAGIHRTRPQRFGLTAFHLHFVATVGTGQTALDAQPRHRTDRRQGFRHESRAWRFRPDWWLFSTCSDGRWKGQGRRCPMPQPSSVTRSRALPPPTGGDLNACRPGVKGVVNQFPDDAGRTLDHFASGNLVDKGFR